MTLLIVLASMAGCASSVNPAAAVWRDIIEVGQPWPAAKAAAAHANYVVREQDPIPVAWSDQPTGFVLDLDKDYELYVVRDRASQTVKLIRLVAHPNKAKIWRAHLNLESFILPPAPKADGN